MSRVNFTLYLENTNSCSLDRCVELIEIVKDIYWIYHFLNTNCIIYVVSQLIEVHVHIRKFLFHLIIRKILRTLFHEITNGHLCATEVFYVNFSYFHILNWIFLNLMTLLQSYLPLEVISCVGIDIKWDLALRKIIISTQLFRTYLNSSGISFIARVCQWGQP